MKLTAKLVALLTGVALLPLVVVSVLSFRTASELLTESIHTELATRTRGELDRVEHRLARSLGDLRTWSRLRIMQDVLIEDADGELRKELARLGERYSTFARLSVLAPGGAVVASSDPERIGKRFDHEPALAAAAGGEPFRGDVGPVPGAGDALILAEPIRADYDDETVIGVLVGLIDWSAVRSQLGDVLVTGHAQDAERRLLLIDTGRGTVLYDSMSRDLRPVDGALVALPDGEGVQDMTFGESRYVVGTALARGAGELAASPWRLHTLLGHEEAYAEVVALRDRFVLVGATLTVMLLVLGLLGARRVSRPLAAVAGRLQDIAAGEGDLTATLDIEGRDEVASLAGAFNQFVTRIRAMVGEIGDAGRAIHHSVEDLKGIAGRTSHDVERQRAETDSAVATVEQMVASVKDVADSAAHAARAGREAEDQAQAGTQTVAASVESIESVAREVERAEAVIRELEQEGGRIGRIVEVIAEIAAQSNILALNATIEAGAAGEHGAGFSVVAREVRTLSQRISDATSEVQRIIAGLRERTGEAVRVMENGRSRVGESVARAGDVTRALEAITYSIDTISQMSEQIAESTGQQVAAIDGIREHLRKVQQITDGTANGAGQTEASAEDLRHRTASLSALVAQFRIS